MASMLFAFLVCLLGALALLPPSHGSCFETERMALLSIKAGIQSSNQSWLSSWTGHDCCHWHGVACNHETGHVIKLNLRYRHHSYVGKVPPSKLNSSLLHLHHLQHLDLSMNNFNHTTIPDFIASLSNLEYLNLSNAGFSGAIPNTLGNLSSLRFLDLQQSYGSLLADDLHWLSGLTSLQHLDLGFVDLSEVSGWLHDINMLPSLRVLKLPYAQLQGGIHATTLPHLNFTSLRVLDLSMNTLNTTLPQWLFKLSGLVHLDLSICRLYGSIPVAVGNSSNLRVLSLSSNNLNGVIPETLGNLRKLVHLDLSKNAISGEIPEALGNLTVLQYFDASGRNNLSGKLPEIIGNLVHLRFLDLSNNMINGELPKSFGNLAALQQLRMPNNGLSWKFPEFIGKLTGLQELDFSENKIAGALPKTMGNLCRLRTLHLTSNFITGTIDDLINGLSKCIEGKKSIEMNELRLGNNRLNGTVPGTLGQLSKLKTLDLSSNSFEGVITEVHFTNLRDLDFLDFSYNLLRLNVSVDWEPTFNATTIRMCSCRIGPEFPAWLSTQVHLFHLCLSDAGISGHLPSWFLAPNYYLHFLNLSHNNLEGRLPDSFGSFIYYTIDLSSNSFEGPLPKLLTATVIDLSDNSFSGMIPSYSYDQIEVFSLSRNHINGSIPLSFCNFTSLIVLDLSNNNMSGGLPNCWNQMSELGILDLSSNSFLGTIPYEIFSIPQLQSLHLRNNGFSGNLPLSLKNANQLVILDIGENKLTGNIPTWIGGNLSSLIVLRLRSNLFEGIIPEQLSQLTSLRVLDLAHNNLSGTIPHSFGGFEAMLASYRVRMILPSFFPYDSEYDPSIVISTVLFFGENPLSSIYMESILISAKGTQIEYTKVLPLVASIDLSCNMLSGELPNELTKLNGLHFFNLSSNHFIGKIPENIGDLKQIESLDLSRNNLSGSIPSSMSSLYSLNYLNLSYNNLSGKIPSGNQLQTFDSSSYHGNYLLCGSPLQNCTSETSFQVPEGHKENGDTSEMMWLYIGLALGFIIGFWMFIGAIMIKQTIRIAYFRTIDRICDWIYVKVVVYSRRLKANFPKRN